MKRETVSRRFLNEPNGRRASLFGAPRLAQERLDAGRLPRRVKAETLTLFGPGGTLTQHLQFSYHKRNAIRELGRLAVGLHRFVALDGDAIARTSMGPVIPHGAVLGAAIVPEGDRTWLPAETALKQRILHVLVEITQNSVALIDGNAKNARRKPAIDKERLFPGHRMRPNYGMLGARVSRPFGLTVIVKQSAIDMFSVMDSRQS